MTMQDSMILNRTTPAILATLVGVALSLPVICQAKEVTDGVRRIAVAYGDLNLQTESGNKALYNRLRRAAREVCQQNSMSRYSDRAAEVRCRRKAIEAAVLEIQSPQLAALHKRLAVL